MAAAAGNPFPDMDSNLEWHWGDVRSVAATDPIVLRYASEPTTEG